MKQLTHIWRTSLMLALAALFVLLSPGISLADKVILKDGRELEGTIKREGDSFVFFVYKIGDLEVEEFFPMSEIKEIVREEKPETPIKAESKEEQRAAKIADGATRIAFISLGEGSGKDMVGPYMNAEALSHSVEMLESHEPDIVVLRINSGGGALYEIQKLSDVIQDEIKPKYRCVAWIESAISAAAMTAWTCEEIYFEPEGNLGACTGFYSTGSGAKAVEGKDLNEVLRMMEKISQRGRHDPLIMRAMQIEIPLSCNIDASGNITWFASEEGEHLVNPAGRILTLNAVNGKKYGVSRGTAESKDELAKLLGCHEWVEVGQEADEYQWEFRENVQVAQANIQLYQSKMQRAIAYAEGENDPKRRAARIGEARRYLRELKGLIRRAPSLKVYAGLTDEWFQEMDDYLRDLANPNS